MSEIVRPSRGPDVRQAFARAFEMGVKLLGHEEAEVPGKCEGSRAVASRNRKYFGG